MAMLDSTMSALQRPYCEFEVDEAQLAVAAFLARYSGRTLDAYRHDLRGFFQWAAECRPRRARRDPAAHRAVPLALDGDAAWRRRRSIGGCRRCAASTASPTSTVGSRRTRPSTSADHKCIPSTRAGWTARELGAFLFTAERYDHAHAALAVLLGSQRAAGQRSVRDEHRGPRHRTRPSHPAHRRQGQQARG